MQEENRGRTAKLRLHASVHGQIKTKRSKRLYLQHNERIDADLAAPNACKKGRA